MRWSAMSAALVWAALAASARADAPLGRDVEGLVAHVRQFSPALQAAVLEADAATARAAGAYALDDPVFRVSFEDLDRGAGVAPRRLGSIFYTVEQEFPLWGKRGLRRDVALAEATALRGRERALALELEGRVKAAFARTYQAARALEIAHEIHELSPIVTALSERRFAQGLGGQGEVLRSLVEQGRLAAQIEMHDRELRTSQARLNALLDRPVGSPLADPAALAPLPARLDLDSLVAQAEAGHPLLAAERAEIAAAEGRRRLADKAWYPDLTLGLTAVDRGRRLDSYEAMASFRIPLQGDLKEAAKREATARVAAGGARLRAAAARLRGELEEALAGLQSMARFEAVLEAQVLPQAEASRRTALAGYEQGRGALSDVLEADRRWREARLDLLRAQVEQRVLLAELERVVGGPL